MAADEPPYLNVGTDVSAKYKGAFCEAKIKKVNRIVKCKVTFKNNLGSAMIPDEQIKGSLRIGAEVEARHPEKNQYCEAVINKLQDYSQYTVVFDDGDETTLRRTSLCLKSGRHFAESPTLDQFPLTNPEHFGTPVIGTGKSKRKRRSTMNSASVDYESSDEELIPRKVKNIRGKDRDPDLGKVVCVDFGDRRKKDNWYPGLVVSNPVQSNIKISRDEYLIRSFKDGKYYQVPKRDTREFTKDCIQKVENNSLKIAVEKAILYYEKEELPPHWDKALFMGLDLPIDEESHDSDSDTSDDEPSEEKDRFVAQLYKFMDERGTPINKAPTVGNRDLNLYKLFKIMHKMGGYNKVTNQNKWKIVYIKMGLPSSNSAGSNQIKVAYKRYLHSFEDFNRKLGCTMQTNSRTRGGRHRSDRNIIITRTRDRDASSSKGKPIVKDSKDKVPLDKKSEDKIRHGEKKEGKSEEKADEKIRTPEKKKSERLQPDDKDKVKKDDKPRLVRSHSLNKDKKDSITKDEAKKETKPEKARTREDARKEKNESPEKKGTRSSLKIEQERKEKEESEKKDPVKDKKEKPVKDKDKKEERPTKDVKEEKLKDKKDDKVKEKKDDKIVKEKKSEKFVKEKKPEEKVAKDKDKILRDKKEDKPLKDKKEPVKSEDKEIIKCKIEERLDKIPVDDKLSLKSKKERFVKDKREEKFFRSRREDKSPVSESEKKGDDPNLSKKPKEDIAEKSSKDQPDVKKEDPSMKDAPKCKFLRERREGTSLADDSDEEYILEFDGAEIKGGASQESDNDSFYKRGPGSRSGLEDDFPTKSKRRVFKGDDREDKESLLGMSDSDDGSFTQDCDRGDLKGLKQGEIEIGDRVKVKYGRGRMQKVYEAKVLKVDTSGPEKRYYVHYAGWNMRYDEWVRKSYIVANMSECNRIARKQKLEMSNAPSSSSPLPATTSFKKIDRSRPPGAFLNAKLVRKNSTSSTNSSVSCPRTTRSDKKGLQTSPFTSGLKPRRRMRKKSGISTGLTDTSQDSYSDGEDPLPIDLDDDLEEADGQDIAQEQTDNNFKEELFSDDEEKEKQEEVKREDITELEKAISVEETTNDSKESFINKIMDVDICKPGESKLLTEMISEDFAKDEGKLTSAKVNTEEKCEIRFKSENVVFTKKPVPSMIEGKFEKKLHSYDQQSSRIVAPSISIDPFTSIYKPNSAFTPVAEKKEEKLLIPKATASTNSGSTEFPFKRSYLPVVPSPTLERNLSFAGLIQKNTFEKISHPETSVQKERFGKIGACVSSTLQTIKPSVLEKDIKSFDLSKYKQPTLIVEAKTVLKSETVLKPIPKEMTSFKETIKPLICSPKISNVAKEHKIENKPEIIVTNPKVVPGLNKMAVDKKDVVICENPFKSKEISLSNPILVKPLASVQQPLSRVLVPAQSVGEIKKENPPKDSFDYLLKSSTIQPQEHSKTTEVKSIFPITFTSNPVIKEKHISEPLPHAKPVSILSEGLKGINTSMEGRVKTKPTETVDLSKAIPGILERLKKDVVAETKFSDSPPPQREELSFDFLCGTHEATKSLSHSDSSNSLRICEDMSDTNDSNHDSRELPLPKRVEPLAQGVRLLDQFMVKSTEMQRSCTTDVSNVPRNDNEKIFDVSEKLSVESKKLSMENKEKEKAAEAPSIDNSVKEIKSTAQKTSVITAAASAALSVVSAVSLPESSDNPAMTKDNFSVVLDSPKQDSSSSSKSAKSFIDSDSSSSSPMPAEKKSDLGELSKEITSEITKIAKHKEAEAGKVASNVSQENKDALFDDLLKIKSTTNFSQGSVIKRVPESEKIVPQNVPVKEITSISEVTKNVSEENVSEAPITIEPAVQDKDIPSTVKPCEEKDAFDKLMSQSKDECLNPVPMSSSKVADEDAILPEDDSSTSTIPKKEVKKKKSKLSKLEKHRSSSDGFDKEDSREGKMKDGKGKSKKRVRLESDDQDKGKLKKVKKNKSKKRFAKHDEQFSDYLKKLDLKEDESKDSLLEKGKKKDKRKMDKKFIKGGTKSDEGTDTKGEGPKKKKGKKNRDKFGNEKKDLMEKKLKKKKKLQMDDNLDSDSDKDCVLKVMDKKKKKERKKFKAKDGSSSDEGNDDKMFKQQGKDPTDPLPRQDSKSDDPDMSFLFCEEKVPASPVDDSSGSLSNEETNSNNQPNSEAEQIPAMNRYQRVDNMGHLNPMNKHSIDTCAVLDNTPPTTPSSTESLLSSSPSHDRDAFSMNYPESTQSGRESGEGESDVFHCNNSHRTVMRESEEYCAATTLAFAVCTVNDKPKDIAHQYLKRQKSETEEHSPSKRKKKSKRMRHSSESAKSPRHKSSLSRMPKDESGCEDSSGTSPATSNSPPYGTSTISTSFSSSSPHRLSSITDPSSRYSFCAPLQDKDPEKRIAILQDKMTQLRKEYMALKAEVAMIDRRRKKARKKVRDTAGSVATNPSVQSEDGQSCS